MDVALGLGVTVAVVIGIPGLLALLLVGGKRCTCRYTPYGRSQSASCKTHPVQAPVGTHPYDQHGGMFR